MNKNGVYVLIISFTLSAMAQFALGNETVGEKIQVKAKDVNRGVKKGFHRTQESVCLKSDVKCLNEKMENRLKETRDEMTDGAKEVINKID